MTEMTRKERLQQSFTKEMRLLEIGASYSPIVPKAEGWHTTVVDHADRATLATKYAETGSADKIEEVDYIWRDGSLLDAIPVGLHGSFDGLIASHVAEHFPDLIGFFNTAATLLKPTGVCMLALPDKRLCFDYFQPLTTTGQLIDARGATRHSRGVLYDHAAYFAHRGGESKWEYDQPIKLAQEFTEVRKNLGAELGGEYHDAHTWRFTPASFELLVLELNLLRLIPWAIHHIEPALAVEFYVWLEKRQLPDGFAAKRLSMLQETVLETNRQIAQLDPTQARPEPPKPPTISAIIPLYNGAPFIEEALRSILAQTITPKEIIVVDDGSTDRGAELVAKMAERYPITLLSKPNGGQSSARNFGVRYTTSDLIALLDQDDIWYPTHLEYLRKPFLTASESAELGWVYSDLDEIDTNGGMIHHSFLASAGLGGQHPKRSLFACLQNDMFVLPSASLIRRTAFDAIGGFDERLSGYEDDDLFLRLFRAGYSNEYVKLALSKWRIYPESYSYSYRMRRSRAIFCRKLLQEYPDDPKRSRFLHRDLILPRFYGHAIAEYRNALASRDPALIKETRDELQFLVNQMPNKKRLAMMLNMVRSDRTVQMAFTARRYAPMRLRRIMYGRMVYGRA